MKFRIRKETDGFGNEQYFAQVRHFLTWYYIDSLTTDTDYPVSYRTYENALEKVENYKKKYIIKKEIFNIE